MSDDFNDDLNTPTEADLDELYGSKYLGAADIGDKRVRTRIGKVRKEMMPQTGGRPERAKFVIYFTTLDKPMVLNATNKNALVDKLGRVPANWIGAEVGLLTELTQFQGKPTKGLRLRVLSVAKPAAPKSKPAAGPPPNEPGDPGPFADSWGEAAE
jgi:hypothetical protein